MLGFGTEKGRFLSQGCFGIVKAANVSKTFFDAAGIKDELQMSAIQFLIANLVEYGLLGKMIALYPMIGGSATSHKYNMLDPRDEDSAYRLTFNGGWTHSATGAKPNGTNGYADTYINVRTNPLFTYNSRSNEKHFAYYSRTSVANTQRLIGVQAGSNGNELLAPVSSPVNNTSVMTGSLNAITLSGSQGFFAVSRLVHDASILYTKNEIVNTVGQTSVGAPGNFTCYIGAANVVGTAGTFSACECALASIGYSMTSEELVKYYQIVQMYQTMLGRQV